MADIDTDTGEETYQEREAVAIFADEAALNAAVDALLQAGWEQADMSLLAHAEQAATLGKRAEELADSDDVVRAAYVSPDSRTEGATAAVGGPALIAGMGTAAIVTTAGVALIPILAATIGSTVIAGGAGFAFARAFGRRHANAVQDEIANGGLLLWVHAPDPKRDETLLSILRDAGGKGVHLHVATREWGVNDVPFHDAQPDPFLR